MTLSRMVVSGGGWRAARFVKFRCVLPAVILSALMFSSRGMGETTTLVVGPKSNIWGAGHTNVPPGTDGLMPPVMQFAPGPGKVLTLSNVTGTIDYHGGHGANGPDGQSISSATPWEGLGPYRGISGVDDAYWCCYLVGVFLGDQEPADPAPPNLNFSDSAIGRGFLSLAPEIGQVFFVGDGLTGSGAGTNQLFLVPSNATRLYLGFMDSHFGDNTGEMIATCTVALAGDFPVRLSNPSLNENTFRVELHGLAGRDYILQTSSNLLDWVPLKTNSPISTPFLFNHLAIEDGPRFYRTMIRNSN